MLARAAELTCGHYLPVARAARLLEDSFLPRVRELLGGVGVLLHVDETPARGDGAQPPSR